MNRESEACSAPVRSKAEMLRRLTLSHLRGKNAGVVLDLGLFFKGSAPEELATVGTLLERAVEEDGRVVLSEDLLVLMGQTIEPRGQLHILAKLLFLPCGRRWRPNFATGNSALSIGGGKT